MNEEIIPEYFTKDMSEIAWSLKEYGLDDVAVNVQIIDGERIYSVIHVDSGNALPLYTKPMQKYFYNREDL